MNGLVAITVLAVGLFGWTASASGQYANDQPKTLKGIKDVVINFQEPAGKIEDSTEQDIWESAILEMRKAGIRVVRTAAGDSVPKAEVLVNLTISVQTGIPDFVNVRMDVEQKATIVRTSETYQLVTWFYEDSQNGSWRGTAKPMAIKAVNKLISDWLDANGR